MNHIKQLKFNIMSVHYGKNHILNDVSGDILTGEMVAITGESGVGKTTLLNALKSLTKMYGIVTIIDENNVRRPHMNDIDMYYASCSDCLLNSISVYDNMHFIQYMYHNDGNDIDSVFQRLDIMDCLHKLPQQLSSGQYKRVLLAGGILSGASFLLLDEPTSNLDQKSSDIIIDVLQELIYSKNIGCLVATHDPNIISIADDEIHLGESLSH